MNILITGKNSYIGEYFKKWLTKWENKYAIDTVDTMDGIWEQKDFTGVDVVFHVAGIAHVSTNPNMEELYYKVNRDLTIAVARKAKASGVKQFIFMSSIIVYGDSTSVREKNVITKETVPKPANFYGKSKLEAEEGIRQLEDENFKVVIVRPPMIYGKGSKGNYPRLAKLACKVPVFPNIPNERSMLHIDNLCEFIRLMIEHKESGTFYPQNTEYVNTSDMVKQIAEIHGKKIILVKCLNPLIKLMGRFINLINKVFGNLVYDKHLSHYKEQYCVRSFRESLIETEKES